MATLRKKNRLGKWLYARGGFFVTLCTQNRISYFGDVGADNIRLNLYGNIIEKYRLNIPILYKNATLGDFVIMPNHIHGILFIDTAQTEAIDNRPYGDLSKVIKGFKQITTKQLHQVELNNFQRQKSFYDHIIRNDSDLLRIQEYIELNPYKRKNDEYYIG